MLRAGALDTRVYCAVLLALRSPELELSTTQMRDGVSRVRSNGLLNGGELLSKTG